MSTPVSEEVNLSKYIDNTLMSGRPHIRGRRVPVWTVQASYEAGRSIAEIAYDFTITEEQIFAALLYYREHKAEIDAQIEEDNRLFDEMYEKQDEKWKLRFRKNPQ